MTNIVAFDTKNFEQRVAAVRSFNRFYTKKIGVLHEGLLRTRFSLAEARVIYELAHHEQVTASELAAELNLDPAYLSRLLRQFGKLHLLRRTPSTTDGRKTLLTLSDQGEDAFARLNSESQVEIASMLESLSSAEQQRLLEAMQAIELLLGAAPEHGVPYVLRPPQPGDMGWVVQRHGVLYAQEYGWDEHFEALVAEIVANFVKQHDPKRERAWIAERNGENVGSVFLVKKSATIGQLRLLLVEPKARGLGIGTRLVEECIRHARRVGYKKLTLWTNDVLHAARGIYVKAGFRMLKHERHHSFGHDLVGQHWELRL